MSLYSPKCRICETSLVYADERAVCRDCLDGVYKISGRICGKCGKIIGSNRLLCGECILVPPLFRRHLSYTIYDGVIRDLILLFKYGEIRVLGKLMAGYYREIFEKDINENFDFLIPVPNDRKRHKEFQPVKEIASYLSRSFEIKLSTRNLVKVKTTEPQANLSGEKRRKNLNDAFQLKKPLAVEGKKVLLIDDVYTTGTTIKKCSELLTGAKADVFALTLARSI